MPKRLSVPHSPIAALVAVVAAILWTDVPAGAQAPASAPLPQPTETVNLTMEQKHVIKEIILKDMKVPEQDAKVAPKPGLVVPQGVPLQPLPVEVSAKVPQVRTHSYFVEDGKVVIVDPKDNKIATVVE